MYNTNSIISFDYQEISIVVFSSYVPLLIPLRENHDFAYQEVFLKNHFHSPYIHVDSLPLVFFRELLFHVDSSFSESVFSLLFRHLKTKNSKKNWTKKNCSKTTKNCLKSCSKSYSRNRSKMMKSVSEIFSDLSTNCDAVISSFSLISIVCWIDFLISSTLIPAPAPFLGLRHLHPFDTNDANGNPHVKIYPDHF